MFYFVSDDLFSLFYCRTVALVVNRDLYYNIRLCVVFVGTIPIMWVELVLSVLLIPLGICLLVGINHVCNSLLLQLTK